MKLNIQERIALSIALEDKISEFEKNAEISKSIGYDSENFWTEKADFYKSLNEKLGFGL